MQPGGPPYPIHSGISRRTALKFMLGAAAATALPASLAGLAIPAASSKSINPKWYGFNLLEYFSTDPDWRKYFPYKDGEFQEDDFRWMRDWGFNWVRLPMDYRFWTDPNDALKIREKKIEPIDRAIRLGEKYGIHVNLSLHRAPGECVLDGLDEKLTGIHITEEKTSVYNNQATLDAFVHQWVYFARRYRHIPSDRLSFNLMNEPIDKSAASEKQGHENYVRVARPAIAAIRAVDPHRLIVTDGYPYAAEPIPELFDTGVLQSCHDYFPFQVTTYREEWGRSPGWEKVPAPAWPQRNAAGKILCDKQILEAQFRPWGKLAEHGVPIHCGEMGCGKYTPPQVVYDWFHDSLDVLNGLDSGWALWNFRGPAGILDTGRAGTHYKNWHGHHLDFTLLQLLQSKMKA